MTLFLTRQVLLSHTICDDPTSHSVTTKTEWGITWTGPIIVLVMARVRQKGESSLINSVICKQ